MTAAAALPQPTPSPDPGDDQDSLVIPHRFVRILAVLRALLGFGQQRMTGLEQSWPQLTSAITRAFGSTDWDKTWWDVTWGLLLLEALTDWLKDRLAKLRDGVDIEELLLPPPPRRRSRSKAARAQAAEGQDNAAQPDAAQQEEDDRFRTTDDIVAWMRVDAELVVRHNTIGKTVAEICRYLGVHPAELGEDLWRDVRSVIEAEGGSLGALRDHLTQCWRTIEGTVPPNFASLFKPDPPATGPPFG